MSDRFDSIYRELSTEERNTISILKSKASELYSLIETSVSPENEYYLNQALSKLEEVVMLSVRGLTIPPTEAVEQPTEDTIEVTENVEAKVE